MKKAASHFEEVLQNQRVGVQGLGTAAGADGVLGTKANGVGVEGIGFVGLRDDGPADGFGVAGSAPASGRAGQFNGDVAITGTLTKGGGFFKIDHPLDAANKYLYHSFVESPDMKNIYDGVVVLDQNGEAIVRPPEWFEALNKDFRYQLTCIGGFAAVYIAKEIRGNRFKIAGGKRGVKVSWQVTGIRQDAFAKAYPIVVEQDKPTQERGTYLHPELFSEPASKSIGAARRPTKTPDATNVGETIAQHR